MKRDPHDYYPTLYGIETEYSHHILFGDQLTLEVVGGCHAKNSTTLDEHFSVEELDYEFASPDAETLAAMGLTMTQDGYLTNGGRLYIDPSGLEYATPEVRTAEEAVHRMFDADELIFRYFRRLQNAGQLESFQVNRRIVDHDGSSRGIHINTASNKQNIEYDQVKILASLNIAKAGLLGSGGLLVDEDTGETHFHHSPRLSLTDALFTDSFTMRPLVRYPFKNDIGTTRIETITSDALNFPWPMRASLVVTNAVIKLLELGLDTSEFPLCPNEVASARSAGRFGNDALIDVEIDNETLSMYPNDILEYFARIAIATDEEYKLYDEETLQVLHEIIDTVDAFRIDPARVASRVESYTRKAYLERKMAKYGVDIDSERICRLDYLWDMIGGGAAEQLREKSPSMWHGFSRGFDRRARERRMIEPPKDTRAKLRSEIIASGGDVKNWHECRTPNSDHSIYMQPYSIE